MASRRPLRPTTRRRSERAARRLRRLAAALLLAAVALATLVLTAFGAASPAPGAPPAVAAPVTVAAGPPEAQIVALHGPLRLQLPVAQESVTAIGYHGAGAGALPLRPLGRQGNRSLLRRLVDRLLGAGRDGLVWYQLESAGGPQTSALDVGSAPGTAVFAPVDGWVVGITDFVLNGRRVGARIDLQPANAPSLVVAVTRLRPDPRLTVGAAVAAGTSRIGTVVDLAAMETHALARYTQDAGNHVTVEVRPAAALALP